MDSSFAQILIIDLGSQYTSVIARELLKLGFKTIVLKPSLVLKYLSEHKPKGIILSGGASSVYDADAPVIPDEIFKVGCPILGICFGMQYLAYMKDKSLVAGSEHNKKEYGPIDIILKESPLFEKLNDHLKVWASHGDIVRDAPRGFRIIASSNNAIEAMEDSINRIYGVQFHPEVAETEDNNLILYNFASLICGCVKDWKSSDVIKEIQNETLNQIGEGQAAIGVSGGVDSTTLACMLAPVMKKNLYAFLIDTGAMRFNEVLEVGKTCKKAGINLHIIGAENEFFKSLSGIADAEEKRRKFKDAYQLIYKKIIKENKITHVLQGTLATDLIESGHLGDAATIKSHHNVGLDFGVKEITPFAKLFKHEVREISRNLGLENEISERKPFPGPGLFVRIVGVPVTPELIEKVRLADHIVTDILKKENFYKDISQIVVALLGSKTVGVQGDSRSYEYPIVVRAVSTTDFMTVKGFEIPSETRKIIISEVTKHGFNRVFFDETPKPPATTELE
ncbi:MAG TPA: glutamine-hydrolyzing GMP synthase [Candidatus Paceibacterota bacterium]|nr:glutamine-hydrolyzing GMP synthase [Candidatus Paceibacterota bacterium]